VEEVLLGIGGSATTDAGFGMLASLTMGFEPFAERPRGVPDRLEGVWLQDLDPDLGRIDLRIACDVSNPLLGPSGAAAVYGPQKGVTPEQVAILDRRIERFATLLESAAGRVERETPGAGAAGGVGFALLGIQDHFRSFALRPGIELVMEATDFAGKLAKADLVITGEGRIDAQTAFGKTALGVAQQARAAGKPCIAVGGGVEPAGIDALGPLGVVVVPVVERPQSVEEAMTSGAEPLERCGERLARLVGLVD
jgi:glycerate kinase